MNLLQVDNLEKHGRDGFVLRDISFSLNRFKKLVIAGETGSGKSTLLRLIGGLEQPDKGTILFEGEQVRGPAETLVPGHPRIAYLSQHFELAKFLRVEQVLNYANKFSEESFDQLLRICQIDHLLKRTTDQLSGGERQRIALCRLLIESPKLLLLDEPYSHLDLAHKDALKTVVADICRELKISCILVSHDPDDTLPWADKILVLRDGKCVQEGTPGKIYFNPINEYAASLFGKYSLVPHSIFSSPKRLNHAVQQALIVRPENIVICKKDVSHFKAVAEQCNFYGSHYEVTASYKDATFIIRHSSPIQQGKQLFLRVTEPA